MADQKNEKKRLAEILYEVSCLSDASQEYFFKGGLNLLLKKKFTSNFHQQINAAASDGEGLVEYVAGAILDYGRSIEERFCELENKKQVETISDLFAEMEPEEQDDAFLRVFGEVIQNDGGDDLDLDSIATAADSVSMDISSYIIKAVSRLVESERELRGELAAMAR